MGLRPGSVLGCGECEECVGEEGFAGGDGEGGIEVVDGEGAFEGAGGGDVAAGVEVVAV